MSLCDSVHQIKWDNVDKDADLGKSFLSLSKRPIVYFCVFSEEHVAGVCKRELFFAFKHWRLRTWGRFPICIFIERYGDINIKV